LRQEKQKEAAKGLLRKPDAKAREEKKMAVGVATPRSIPFRAAAKSAFQGGLDRRSKSQSCLARLGAAGPDGPGFARLFFACPRSGPSRFFAARFFLSISG